MEINDQALESAEPTPDRSRRRGIVAVLAGAAVMIAVIGVPTAIAAGPTIAPSPDGAVTLTPLDPEKVDAAFTKFAACMRDHGVDMPDPVTVSTDRAGTTVAPDGEPGGGPVFVTGSGSIGGVPATGAGAEPGTITAPVVDEKLAAASEACSPILDEAGIPTASGTFTNGQGTLNISGGSVAVGAGPGTRAMMGIVVAEGDVTKQAASMKAYAACMRDHGVDVPDPVVDTTAGSIQLSVPGDPGSKEFRGADAACATDGFSFAPPAPPTP